MRSSEANQEFTHIATPEENAYIEAYHSIYDREVLQRFELSSYYEANLTTAAYNDFYNNRRLHGADDDAEGVRYTLQVGYVVGVRYRQMTDIRLDLPALEGRQALQLHFQDGLGLAFGEIESGH